MVTALKVTNYLGESLTIDPFDPESSGFLITDIQGITPIKGTINVTSLTTNDGGLFNSSRIDTRNITMKLVFLPRQTIEQTRLLSYKMFPVKREVTLDFTTENRKARISGYVESNSINIFSKMEFASISIICPDPYFYSTEESDAIDVKFAGIDPQFSFPFPETSAIAPELLFGGIQTYREQIVNYKGDSEIGMEIIVRAHGDVGNLTISNIDANEAMYISSTKINTLTGHGIISGDVITISTHKGNKKITLLRNGVSTNILNSFDRNSTWLQLRKGGNRLGYTASSGAIYVELEIKSSTIYEGL